MQADQINNESTPGETGDNIVLLNSPNRVKFTILATALVTSICGISYELLAATISNYFLGNAALQYSLTIGVFLFAMGIGSYLSSKFEKDLLDSFILVEIIIGLVGGFATLILFTAYRFTDQFSIALYGLLLFLGTMIGLEVPLLIRVLKDYKALKFSIADVLSFDYMGALGASILFPLLVLPVMGMMQASFFYALINMVVVFFNISVFKPLIKSPGKYMVLAGIVSIILLIGLFSSARLVSIFENKLYDDEVIFTKQTKYQRIVLTRYRDDLRMFIDGNLQFSSWDEYRYHECLVHPAMSLAANREEVLILGGGDGIPT
jgi:spermidine synthase